MAVYLDLAILINFLVDFLLLMGTNRLAGYPPGWKRAALAAGLGAGYAGGCLLPGFSFLQNRLWALVALIFMAGTAFGWNRSAFRRGSVFLLLSMAMGGVAAEFVRQNFWGLVTAGALVWLLCRLSFRGSLGQREYVPVTLRYGDKTLSLLALRDTGNTLKDPLTGEPVLVAGADVAEKLLDVSQEELKHPVELLGKRPGLRLIPYHTAGSPLTMMVACRFRDAAINGKPRSPLVAFAPEEIGRGEEYQMLTGGVV